MRSERSGFSLRRDHNRILPLDTEAAKDIFERTGKGCFTLLPAEKAGWKVRDRNPEEVSSVSIDIDSCLFLKA